MLDIIAPEVGAQKTFGIRKTGTGRHFAVLAKWDLSSFCLTHNIFSNETTLEHEEGDKLI